MKKLPYISAFVGVFAFVIAVVTGATGTQTAYAACSGALPSSGGTATLTVNVPAKGKYRVWTHIYAPSGSDNGAYLRIDNTYCQITVGDNNSMPANQFAWVDYQDGNTNSKINADLTAGNHTLVFAGLDSGVGIDKVLLTADGTCVPTGDGSNCTNGGTDTGNSTPGGATTSGSNSSNTKATYLLDGKPVDGAKLDTSKLQNGTYTLEIRETDAQGNTTVRTERVVVNNDQTPAQHAAGLIRRPIILIPAGALLLLASLGTVMWTFRPELLRAGMQRATRIFGRPSPYASINTTETPEAVVVIDRPAPTRKWWGIAGAVTFGVSGASLMVLTFAATVSASYILSNASLSSGATVVSHASAIGGKMVRFSSATPTTPPPTTPPPATEACALPKYPTPACTGIPAGTNLSTVSGSVTLSTNGQVLDAKLVTGDVIVSANNVVIKNSEVRGRIRNTNGQSFTLQDSLVGPTSGCADIEAVGYQNYTARRVQMRNVSDGFRVSGNDVLIEDSYIKLCSSPGDHSDGIQGYYGGTNVRISHNTIDQREARDVTSPIFFADNSESAIITNNLLMGGGFTLRIHDDFTPDKGPWVVTGNRLVQNAWDYGPASTSNTNCATTTWSDNRLVTINANYDITSTGATVSCN